MDLLKELLAALQAVETFAIELDIIHIEDVAELAYIVYCATRELQNMGPRLQLREAVTADVMVCSHIQLVSDVPHVRVTARFLTLCQPLFQDQKMQNMLDALNRSVNALAAAAKPTSPELLRSLSGVL
jgi:hypothetical protein